MDWLQFVDFEKLSPMALAILFGLAAIWLAYLSFKVKTLSGKPMQEMTSVVGKTMSDMSKQNRDAMEQMSDYYQKTIERTSAQYQRFLDNWMTNAELSRASQAEAFAKIADMQKETAQTHLQLAQITLQMTNAIEMNTAVVKASRDASVAAFGELGEKIEKEHQTTRGVIVENHEKTQRVFRSYWGENAGGNKYA